MINEGAALITFDNVLGFVPQPNLTQLRDHKIKVKIPKIKYGVPIIYATICWRYYEL